MNVAILPIFPIDKGGLTAGQCRQIVAHTTTVPSDSFGLLAMIFGDGMEASHGAPKDFAVWNEYAPGTARYAAFALGYAVGVARWEAGMG